MISEEKIKVFISSKCGGERINFDQLVNADSEDKKDVAAKAIRTSYDLIRRALKFSLEETGFIRTYVFEDGSASTLSSQEDYFDELDTSDVCLFLIDNFDEKISDGLLAEITRAQNLNKKSFYLFLNDPNNDKTSIQKNLIGANGARYVEINDIREFINVGYRAVVNDIVKIYQMYCRGNWDDLEKALSVEITKENFSTETTHIDKQVFKNLGLTKNKLLNLVHGTDEKNVQSSDLDKFCLNVVEFLLGEKKLSEINVGPLLETLQEFQSTELHNLVSKRWDVFSSFYSGDLDNAIKTLESIYNEYSELGDTSIPKWLLNDILIDWRNLSTIDNQVENVIDFSIQEKIDKQESLVFFPLIDRFSTNVSNDISNRSFDILTSPYSNFYFNLDSLFGYISNYLFTAIYYGSFTHIVFTLDEIQKVLFDVVQKENNLLHKIQLMKVSILRDDKEDFTKIIGKYKSALSHSTTKEILDLYKLADTKPLPYQRIKWKVILFKEIGYYFSDLDYEVVAKEILDFSEKLVSDQNPNITLVENLIDSFKSNRDRLSQEKITYFAIEVFNKKHYRFFDSIFDLLSNLNYPVIPRELLNDLLSKVNEMLTNEEIKQSVLNIKKFFIRIRKRQDDFSAEIDEIVEKYYPEFYNGDYDLEVFPNKRINHIQRYLDNIRSRNKVQGKGGKYIVYGDNPYITIKNIIEIDGITLSAELLNQLLTETMNTLLSGTQTYSEKINSLQLVLCLKMDGSYSYDWSSYFSNLKQDIAKIENGHTSLFEQDNALLLQLHLIILRIIFGEDCLQEILEILALINNGTNSEIMNSLIALEDFLRVEKDKLTGNSITPVVIQYISAFCFHDDDYIRYHTVQVLYQLIDSQYANFVVNRLAKMMDDNDFRVKLAIVRQAHLTKAHSIESFNYITTKAQIDNNYLVRKSLENIAEK